MLFNIIMKNTELPATCTKNFSPIEDNQKAVRFNVMESLTTEDVVEPDLGKEIGSVVLKMPPGVTTNTEIEVTFRLDESGLLHFHAKELLTGREIEADFQTTEALSEQEISDAKDRNNRSSIN